MGPVIDQRLQSIQADSQQMRSINDFTDSLVSELNVAEGTPAKALMRELLAGGLRRALDIGGTEPKRRFLEALSVNIHKFPLQEQQSLARVHPVEISSEYRNLQSFVEDAGAPEEEPRGGVVAATSAAAVVAAEGLGVSCPAPAASGGSGVGAAECPAGNTGTASLAELRRRLAALPPRPGPAAEELAPRLLQEEALRPVQGADARGRAAFFGDLRLNLFKFSEQVQRELVERFQELRAEVARLVVSMTQEISRWLDEEKVAVQQGSTGPLLAKLRALFQAVLSAPFSATFKHLGTAEKKGKEAFLLKIALCLRTCQDRHFTEAKEIGEQAGQLRRQFFYVEGYGELMEDWLQNRIRQFNEEEFPQRVTAVLSTSMPSVLARLQRTFRPGCWLSVLDPQFEEDIFALFLDEAFPRHVLQVESIARMLQRVAAHGGAEFHVYDGIARMAPPKHTLVSRAHPRDAVEAALLDVLQRFPPFPPLRRGVRPGAFQFGHKDVEFLLRDGVLLARAAKTDDGLVQDEAATEFFARRGPEAFPDAARAALEQSLVQFGGAGMVCTTIEDVATVPAVQGGLTVPAATQAAQVGQIMPLLAFPPQPAASCPPKGPGPLESLTPFPSTLPSAAVPLNFGGSTSPGLDPHMSAQLLGLASLGGPSLAAPASAPSSGPLANFGLSSLPRGPASFGGEGLGLAQSLGTAGGATPSSAALPLTSQHLGAGRYEPYPTATTSGGHHGGANAALGTPLGSPLGTPFGAAHAAPVSLTQASPQAPPQAPLLSLHPEVVSAGPTIGKFGLDDDEI